MTDRGEPSECHCPMCNDGEELDLLDLPASQLRAADPALYASWLLWQVEEWADGRSRAFETELQEEGTDAVEG